MDLNLRDLDILPAIVGDAGPINVEAELRAVVALTRHYWKHRLNILVEASQPAAPFWGRWWIARLAAMRMLMLAAESQHRAPNNLNPSLLPALRIGGRLKGERFELWLYLESRASAAPVSVSDAMLLMCAKYLDGEIIISTPVSGGSLTSFLFPVRLGTAAGVSSEDLSSGTSRLASPRR